jgi:hypothetical protein
MMACQITEKPAPASAVPRRFSAICYLNPNTPCHANAVRKPEHTTNPFSACTGLGAEGSRIEFGAMKIKRLK